MSKKIHIGFHKAGSTFLQQIVFPTLPNYKGRYYAGSKDKHTDLYIGETVNNGCENILKYYSKFDNHFISNEIFTKLRREKLLELLKKYNYDNVLVVERNLDDLIKSRQRHKSQDFFLQKKIFNKLQLKIDKLDRNIFFRNKEVAKLFKFITPRREKHILTQMEFNDLLGVSYLTFCRWKTGRFDLTIKIKR